MAVSKVLRWCASSNVGQRRRPGRSVRLTQSCVAALSPGSALGGPWDDFSMATGRSLLCGLPLVCFRGEQTGRAAMTDPRGPAPLCKSCTHHHHPGEKCPICGHTGKGKAFAMISRTTGPSSMELHFEGFDRRVDAKLYKNQWTLVRIMRTRIFVDECGVGEDLEFDGHEDNSRHVLGLVGDAPVVYARWRLEDSGGGGEGQVAVVDRMLVMPRHRQQGYANRCLEYLFQDIVVTARELEACLAGVAITTPVDVPQMSVKLAARSFASAGLPYVERGHQFQRMYLSTTQTGPA